MKIQFLFASILFYSCTSMAQSSPNESPCSDERIMERLLLNSPLAEEERAQNEAFTKEYIEQLIASRSQGAEEDRSGPYMIPVVLHVFHNGDDGMIDMAQAQSGIDVLNTDFNGLNSDWNTIDPLFDPIKASLDIQFCLASIDPDGNPTTGVNYYDDSLKMLNEGDLFQHAWDNYKYLNIYLPKYTNGEPSLFTAYAYYPSTSNSNNNTDGVFYSSIRWGYGTKSELTPGQEWASVGTHELGHWLNLIHTFQGGCAGSNDQVSDTPPTEGGTIQLSGCNNQDFSCGVATNGSNYMDYNHDCKKMFTQGQVDRMTAALQLPSRITLWSLNNLIETGCAEPTGLDEIATRLDVNVFPNPAKNKVNLQFNSLPESIQVFDLQGKLMIDEIAIQSFHTINTTSFNRGLYFYQVVFEGTIVKGKFIIE